jgi:hypothetical protein
MPHGKAKNTDTDLHAVAEVLLNLVQKREERL